MAVQDQANLHGLKELDRIGFFGKLPTHGDFVGWGLSSNLQRTLQDWLQAGLQTAKESLGGRWKHAFQTMPPWRFIIEEGLWSSHAIAGVMVASADRVGREFPLVLLSQIHQADEHPFKFYKDESWFTALEAMAEGGQRRDFQLDSFTQGLQKLRRIRPINSRDGDVKRANRSTRESLWWTVLPGSRDVQGFRNEGAPKKDDFLRFFTTSADRTDAHRNVKAAPPPAVSGQPVAAVSATEMVSHLSWTHSFQTHAGTRGKPISDALLASAPAGLFGVSCGSGETQTSAEAAKLAVHLAGQAVMDGPMDQRLRELKGKLGSANTLLRSRNGNPASARSAVASIALLVLESANFAVLWSGDSRCYLFRDGMLRCLTRDHVQIGMRRSLSKALGLDATLQTESLVEEIRPDDIFLLCSGSLLRCLSERSVAETMLEDKSAELPRILIENALIAGCPDNVTALVVRVQSA